MNSSSYTLAIDLGTSGPKVALVSSRGQILDCDKDPVQFYLSPGGGAEQDPEHWWTAICGASQRLLGRYAVSPASITAVSCTTQWSGTVPVDSDGRALMNAIIWLDTRGAPHIKRLTGGLINLQGYDPFKLITWISHTGGVPGHAGKDPIAHILYIKHELPEIYERTYKFLEPKDYLNLRLTGRCAASYDSITLHWLTDNRHISQVDYDAALLKMSGIDRAKLPDLCASTDILGPLLPESAAALGLRPGIPVIVGTPDIQSASIGSGAVRDYDAHLYIGTSSWLACHVPYKKTDLLHNIASLPSGIPGRYLVTNEQECAGGCLQYLRDNIIYPDDGLTNCPPPEDVLGIFNEIAERVPAGSSSLIFTPWLYGERTPVDDHTVRGGFFNLSLSTTRAHMVRAVFEGVAYNSRWLLGYVEKFIKRPLTEVRMVGGGASSDLWCQIHADVFGRTILQVDEPVRVNLRGAGFLAAVAQGELTFDEIPTCVPIRRVFQPQPENTRVYDRLFKEFIQIYARNRGIYARLNRQERVSA